MSRPECEEDAACELIDDITTICTLKDSALLKSRNDAVCTGYEQEVITSLEYPMTADEINAVNLKYDTNPAGVEAAFLEGLSTGLLSVPPQSMKVAEVGAVANVYMAVYSTQGGFWAEAEWRQPILWRARSRLYRRRSLQVNAHFSAFFELYRILPIAFHSIPASCKFFTTFAPSLQNFAKFAEFCKVSTKQEADFARFKF